MKYWHVFAILLILGSAFAAVQVFWPTEAEIGGGASFYLGKASPGHTILIITDRGPKEDPYTRATITPNWPMSYTIDGDRMYIRVTVPRDESGTKQFCLELAGEYSRDSFCPSILITSGLVDFDVQRNVVNGTAGRYVPVVTFLKNASAGETAVQISCSLGEKYCEPINVELRAGDVKQPEIKIMYPFPGTYNIQITMTDMSSGETVTRDVQVNFKPSLQNDMRLLRWGLPIYFPFALPALAITSLVG